MVSSSNNLFVVDADGDGYLGEEDCDDSDALINIGAVEVCDGRDNDCNGEIDEGVLNLYYIDDDGDGYGDGENIQKNIK